MPRKALAALALALPLSSLGGVAPIITVTQDLWFAEGPLSVKLTATAKDDGTPLPANPSNPDPNDPNKLRWNWSVLSRPAASSGVVWSGDPTNGEAFTYSGSSNAPWTVFTCDPTATLDVPGMYLFQFSASDGGDVVTANTKVFVRSTGAYRALGYSYLSPQPGSEYCSPQTRFILVRFQNIAPSAVTNLAQCIQVTGQRSGTHAGVAKIAGDSKTIIYQMSADFTVNELVTVSLNPAAASGPAVQPYQYQFMISSHLPDLSSAPSADTTDPQNGTITARGDNPPNETRFQAFDDTTSTKWLDFAVPNGTANFSWIQYVYAGTESNVCNRYSVASANDAPERDPSDWHVYGVDGAGTLTLLDTQTNQVFANRFQVNQYSMANTNAWRGYRFEVTRIANPATAVAVQLSELEFLRAGSSANPPDTTDPQNGTITARGENPPNETRIQAFDDTTSTKWLDFAVPNGTANFSWIQYVYAGTESNVCDRYTIASANDAPERDPTDWHVYGVDGSGTLTLLDTQTNQVFANRFQVNYYSMANTNAWRGYRFEITRIANPATAAAVQLSELEFLRAVPTGFAAVQGPVATSTTTGAAITSSADAATASAPRQDTAAFRNFGLSTPKFRIMPNGVSIPSDFSLINITTNNNPDPEYIFIDNRGGNGHPYNIIFDNSGSPIWYSRYPDERRDMKVQPTGILTMLARDGGNHFNALNTNYQQVASYWATNGFGVDEHELQILKDGTRFLVALSTMTIDMSRFVVGGNPAASVTEQAIQEFTPAGDLIFQWRAWDHFDIRDQASFIDIHSSGFDFPHMNAVDVDTDGNVILSSRSTSEITKINRDSGQIIWRLGGNENQFTYVNDSLQGPRNQHAVRSVGTNHYTLFDNGDQHSPSVSRGVEYLVNTNNMTATVVWQYPPTPTTSLYSFYMGDVQRLTNGNTLINWAVGNLPKLTEVRPDGSKAFEMNWVNQFEAYRTWRCSWRGVALQPYLIVEPYPDSLTLIFNQFGDTNIAYYRIYGGPAPHPTNLLATSGTALKSLTTLSNGNYYFRVTAVNKSGVEGPSSNETNATVNIIHPGQNMISNGAFTNGTNAWAFTVSSNAAASWQIESGAAHVYITNGGTTQPSVQLAQTGFTLVQGKTYVLQFDAWSTGTRYIDVKVAQSVSPFTDYSRITSPFITPTHNQYRYSFVMTNASDFSASLRFNLGSYSQGVYLANISLFNPPAGDLNLDTRVDYLDLGILSTNWLKQATGIPADLDGNNKVDFKDFGIFGETWSSGIP